MTGDITLTVVGNLTGTPDLRFTGSGNAVANFTIASTSRVYDKTAGEWTDGATTYLRCTAWRQLAENIANSTSKGTRVVATGRLRQRTWETPDGEKRTSTELEIDELGTSLRYATATLAKANRTSSPIDGDPT